ncbi:MAG: prepilin peptidase [Armatimonadetes bacterium]|nr:prepilin peptidase [Armatimonadota bacterium]
MPDVPGEVWRVLAGLFGAVVGSFLNVVIWRMPRNESIAFPGSHCPRCNHELSAWENVPVLSWLLLRAKCRKCRMPISVRYPAVELLNAILWVAVVAHFGPGPDAVAYCLFGSAMIAAFAIDWEHYIIPDEVNAFALFVGIGRDLYGAWAGEPAHALLMGWMPRSVAAGILCASAFVGIQILGRGLFRQDAMGDGDVKLARAIGAVLPVHLAGVSFLFAIGVGAVVGSVMLAVASCCGKKQPVGEPVEAAALEPTPWPVLLRCGLLYMTYLDMAPRRAHAVLLRWSGADTLVDGEDDDFQPGPTHIPFGPYMVLGAGLAVVFGQAAVDWYLTTVGWK